MLKTVKILTLATFFVVLVGCGRYRLNSYLDSFHSQHISTFIAERGAASKVVPLTPTTKMYEWNISNLKPSSDINAQNNITTNINIGGDSRVVSTRELWCTYRVSTNEQDIITNIAWEGNYCKPMN